MELSVDFSIEGFPSVLKRGFALFKWSGVKIVAVSITVAFNPSVSDLI